MPTQVHIYPKLERQLATLERQGTIRSIAAQRARRIINALVRGETPASAGLLKRKTDKRVKNCLKFDLGSGFRLICIREGDIVHVMFVGDHDSADTWLDKNKKKKNHKTTLAKHTYIVDKRCAQVPGTPGPVKDVLDGTGGLHVSQDELRRVFKGLVG